MARQQNMSADALRCLNALTKQTILKALEVDNDGYQPATDEGKGRNCPVKVLAVNAIAVVILRFGDLEAPHQFKSGFIMIRQGCAIQSGTQCTVSTVMPHHSFLRQLFPYVDHLHASCMRIWTY